MEVCHIKIPICLLRNLEQLLYFSHPSIKVSTFSPSNSLVSPNPSYTISWPWQLDRFLSVQKSTTSSLIMDFNGAIILQWQLLHKAKNKVTMLAYLTIGSFFLGIAIKMWAKAKRDCNAHEKEVKDEILVQIYFRHIIHYFWSQTFWTVQKSVLLPCEWKVLSYPT